MTSRSSAFTSSHAERRRRRRRRASGAHNSRCKPAAGERQCPISASGFSPVCFFKCAFLDLLDFLDLNQVALCALVQFLSSVNGEVCRERGASGVHKSRCSASAGLDVVRARCCPCVLLNVLSLIGNNIG